MNIKFIFYKYAVFLGDFSLQYAHGPNASDFYLPTLNGNCPKLIKF